MNHIKAILSFLTIISITLLTGCSTTGAMWGNQTITQEEAAADIKGFELPAKPMADHAIVYVYRPNWRGALVKFPVYVDSETEQNKVCYNRSAQYCYFNVKPGHHVILSPYGGGPETKMILNAEAGKTYFYKQELIPRHGKGTNKLHYVRSQEKGTYFIKNLEMGTNLRSFPGGEKLIKD